MKVLLSIIVVTLLALSCADEPVQVNDITENAPPYKIGPNFEPLIVNGGPVSAPASVDLEWEWNKFNVGMVSYWNSKLWITDGGAHFFATAGILHDWAGNCPYGCPYGYMTEEMTLCKISGDTSFFEVVFEDTHIMTPCLSWYAHFDEPDGPFLGYWRGSCDAKNHVWVDPVEVCDEWEEPGKGDPPPWEW